MDQTHEPKCENLGKCGLEGTKRISSRVPSKGSKIDTWLGMTQSAIGSSDSSSSKTKIISLIHALQLPLPKTAKEYSKAKLTTLDQILGTILQGFWRLRKI